MSNDTCNNSTFFSRYANGLALADEIDCEIERWHETSTTVKLHEFLGLNREEYQLWVSDPDCLPFVLLARKSGQKLSCVIREQEPSLRFAARETDCAKLTALKAWLKQRESQCE